MVSPENYKSLILDYFKYKNVSSVVGFSCNVDQGEHTKIRILINYNEKNLPLFQRKLF